VTLVVKVGGAVGNSLVPVISDLASRTDFVLVHGGSKEVDELGSALGRSAHYYTSPSGVVSRRSDAAHLEVVVLALAGKVQTEIVAEFGKRGVRAVGLSGVDDRLLLARRKEGIRAVMDGRTVHLTDDLSGTIESVNDALLQLLLQAGIAPVVGPPAVTASGEVVNVDADRAAARVAVALGAETLLLLTNVAGLLRDPADPTSLIAHVGRGEFESSLEYARGRMRKKLLAAHEAREGGVPRVVIGPSAGPTPVEAALRGSGTVFD
jgi:[amino group carrier protein]-L-2-aminoadipate/L-glutamate 6-kinase